MLAGPSYGDGPADCLEFPDRGRGVIDAGADQPGASRHHHHVAHLAGGPSGTGPREAVGPPVPARLARRRALGFGALRGRHAAVSRAVGDGLADAVGLERVGEDDAARAVGHEHVAVFPHVGRRFLVQQLEARFALPVEQRGGIAHLFDDFPGGRVLLRRIGRKTGRRQRGDKNDRGCGDPACENLHGGGPFQSGHYSRIMLLIIPQMTCRTTSRLGEMPCVRSFAIIGATTTI